MTLKKNKVAWITGGGTGIGKELALILAKQEYDVIISGRRKEKLIETANIYKKRIYPEKIYQKCQREPINQRIEEDQESMDSEVE